MSQASLFASFYDPRIQLSVCQLRVILGAIDARRPGCRLLVFGMGHDTPFWRAANADGQTLFLETDPEWIRQSSQAGGDVMEMPTFGLTVERCMKMHRSELETRPPPASLTEQRWDVILIDGPPGHQPSLPGRAISIYWSWLLADERADVFVHDVERRLESAYTQYFLKDRREAPCVVVPAGFGRRRQQLLWSIGEPFVRERVRLAGSALNC